MNLELKSLIQHILDQFDSVIEPCRLLHGRGGCFPQFNFLNVDLFGDLIVVMLHESRPEAWQSELSKALLETQQVKGVVIQDRSVRPSEQTCFGEVYDQLTVSGEGVQYLLNPREIKNPGWFLDMREGRAWLAKQAHGCKVLNLFSYTCGFSLVALKNGAELVVNMDMNSSVLNRGKKNHALNQLDSSKAKFFDHNVMKSFGKIKRFSPYDIVVIDPPSIQTGSFQLRRDYPKLMSRLAEWVKPGGLALMCCNDPLIDALEFEAWMKEFIKTDLSFQRLKQPDDYPEKDRNRALKVYVLEI